MNRHFREAIRAFRAAGLDVEVVQTKGHVAFYRKGDLVHTMSNGTKQSRRSDADIRRKIRRIKEGGASVCTRVINRN